MERKRETRALNQPSLGIFTAIAGDRVSSKLSGPASLSEDDLKGKFGPIFEEYLSNCDYAETCRSVCGLFNPNNIATLVEIACSDVLDRSVRDQRKVGELFSSLVRDALLSFDQVAEGLGVILENAQDILVDIPKLWEYLGEILAPVVIECCAVDIFLANCYSSLSNDLEFRNRLTVAVMAVVQRTRPDALARIMAQTASRLDDHVSGGKGCEGFQGLLIANGIKVADSVTNGGGRSSADREVEQQQHQLAEKLGQIFARDLGVNDELELVGSLLRDRAGETGMEAVKVRTLVTALLESVIQGIGGPSSDIVLNNQMLDMRAPILKITLDRKDSAKVNNA
jgi:translation initiation factor 4G